MKKYLPLFLFFYLGYSVDFCAQSLTLDNSFFPIFVAPPSNKVLDFNSISNYHFFNPYAFNPAMAGIEDKRQFNLNRSRQMNQSVSLSYEQPINSVNSAIGINYEYYVKNFNKIHRYGLAYNYGFRWNEKTQLRIGLQFSQIHAKAKDSVLPLDKDKWDSFPSFDLGMAFQYKQLRLGASIQNLVPKNFVEFNEVTESYMHQADTERTLNFSIANTFSITKNWDWSMAVLLRFYNHEIIEDIISEYLYSSFYSYTYIANKQQHDYSSYISFKKKMTIGATYRTQYDPVWIGFVGVKLKEKLNLQFSFNVKKSENEDGDKSRFWEALTQYQF